MDLYSYARKYYEKWKVTPIPIVYDNNDKMIPLIKWGTIYEKSEPVLIKDEKLWKRATGIAIIPRGDHVAIDFDKLPEFDSLRDYYMEKLAEHFVVVQTKRGLHIHFEVEKPIGELRIYYYGEKIGEGGGSLFKHPWTMPPTRRSNFTYTFYKYDDVPELPKYKWEDVKDLIKFALTVDIEEITSKPLKGKNISIAVAPVKNIDQLSVEQLKILLFLIFHDMNCYGLRDLMYEWIKNGMVNMRKFGWGNRTSRFYFLHTITSVLAMIGVPHKKVADLLETYEDLDGKPNDAHESALWTVYEWEQDLFRRLYVMKRGECLFCSIRRYRNCQKNPVLRFYYYLQSRGKEKIEEIVDKLLSNGRT